MTKIEIAKKIASIVVSAGTARIVTGIISNNVEPAGIVSKITIVAASVVIGAMASKAVQEHSDRMIDDVVKSWNKIREEAVTE